MDNVTLRNYLARIDLTTGLVDQDWNPNPSNYVLTMAISGDDLYLGGEFTSIGGQTRNRLAKINKNTGIVDATWNPNSNNLVKTITLSGSDVYVGGAFTSIGGQTRNRIAKLNNTTGVADTLWNPNANDWVVSIATSETGIYLGGWFATIGGQTRNRLAKVNNTTGELYLNWDAEVDNPTPYMWVNEVVLYGTDLYVGGYFDSIAGKPQKAAAKINTDTGVIDPNWNPQFTGTYDTIEAIEIVDDSIILGGQFSSLQSETINNLAKVNMTTAAPDLYFDDTDSMFTFLAVEGKRYWYATEYNPPFFMSYTLESTPPTLSLNSLPSSQLVDSTPTFTGSTTDANAGVSNVEYQIDSTSGAWSNCTSDDGVFDEQTENFSCTPTTSLNEGAHTIYIRAKDTNSNVTQLGSYASKTFTIDTILPTLSITYIDSYKVTPTRWLLNRRPLFEGIADSNTNIQIQIPSANITDSVTSNTSGYWSWRSDTDLSLGTHQVKFSITDGAGNTTLKTITLVVMLSFNNGGQEDIVEQEEPLPTETTTEEEETPTELPIIEEGNSITVIRFLDTEGEPMVSALVKIVGTDYYTDTKGEIQVLGLEENKKYKVEIEYEGKKYESEVMGATDSQVPLVVEITDEDVVKETNWTKILIYGGLFILAIGIIILLSKRVKLSENN